jgi:hypothetical protein
MSSRAKAGPASRTAAGAGRSGSFSACVKVPQRVRFEGDAIKRAEACVSWHYLQGQEAASWDPISLDGAPDALLRSMPTPAASCSLDNSTGRSNVFRSGTTCAPSTADPGAGQLMSSREVSPAKTLALRVAVQDLPDPVRAFGTRCSESLARSGLALSSRKTVRTYVPEALAPSSKDLPAWGMTHAGACWELGTSARRTSETECGCSLPTPSAKAYGYNQGGSVGRSGKKRPSLSTMARDGSWPTPLKQDSWMDLSPSRARRRAPGLMWAVVRRSGLEVAEARGKLNPDWVEWLMGWPIGWTDLNPLATDRFQQWLRSHGGP